MTDAAYKVLALKYRPQTFSDLIGQDAMVQTLKNAFAADRIAHAFVMTGVRGVGKTTTARIIAKGLNCIGPDGQGGPTTEPCGQCGPCQSIAEGRHVDVLELDAASNTQVDKMREILAGVPYRPTEARFKIYIFDEVHMLSTSAFNALLKTLEEPPGHVKFIFATTEIRKVPVTVLSRCQRFDLRRIEPEVMLSYLGDIAGREGSKLPEDALTLLVRASEGSMRDALSLLDQAMAHSGGEMTAEDIRRMLGLADRGRGLDLFEAVMEGDTARALAELSEQYAAGADPASVIQDLAEITHWVSMLKITPEAAQDPGVTPDASARGARFAERLRMPVLTRAWQMLLKAMEEVSSAPNAMMAAEMALIRLTHVADLPPPGELVARLQDGMHVTKASGSQSPGADGGGARAQLRSVAGGAATAQMPAPLPVSQGGQSLQTFQDLLALLKEKDMALLIEVERSLRLVDYRHGYIEFEPDATAAPDLAQRLSGCLQAVTGQRWGISVVQRGGRATIAEETARLVAQREKDAAEHDFVKAALNIFPGAKIHAVSLPEPEQNISEPFEAEEQDPDWNPIDPFAD